MNIPVRYKIIGTLALAGGVFLSGYISGRSYRQTTTTTEKKLVTTEGRTEVVYRDRIVEHEVIKYPDGTQVTKDTTTQENTQSQTQQKSVEKDAKKEVVVQASPSEYRAGLREHLDYQSLLPTRQELIDNLEVTAGKRLGDTPIWLEGGYQPAAHQATIGISIEF